MGRVISTNLYRFFTKYPNLVDRSVDQILPQLKVFGDFSDPAQATVAIKRSDLEKIKKGEIGMNDIYEPVDIPVNISRVGVAGLHGLKFGEELINKVIFRVVFMGKWGYKLCLRDIIPDRKKLSE